ncbi:sensor domain-containing diguanylate cyclase [Alkalisalibacterium limincola]|uniref:diguanylate cyclase n=1 Tax=Alkalisalibacterium limincola TaxID=2699169 RepID=A0A5C8KUQ6_9GAMM|nr:sensor domain-containing diguanylate cyclase [Alkalisalibacterium limincola]TXK64961.1 diguanylate cyclase [Alkalisalibacterium limincola]
MEPQGNRNRYAPGLRFWLGLSYGGLAVMLVLVVSVLVERMAARHLQEGVAATLSLSAADLSGRLEDGLRERLDDMRALSVLPLFDLQAIDPGALQEHFQQLARSFPDYAWIGLVDAQGRVVVAKDGLLEGVDVSGRPWFAGALQGPYLGDLHEAVLLEQLLQAHDDEPLRFLDVAAPVRNPSGDVDGVVAAHLSWAWARRLARQLDPTLLGLDGAELIVMSAEGVVILGPGDMAGRHLPVALEHVSRDRNDGWFRAHWSDGGEYITGFARPSGAIEDMGLGWITLVRQPVGEALAPLRELRSTVAVLAIVLGLLGVGAAVILGRWIGRPLRELAREARRIRERRGGAVLADPGGYREARDLARSLQQLVGDLTGREAELLRLAETLEQRVSERTAELSSLNVQLEAMALSDSLTGLANRRRFNDELDEAVQRATEQGLPLSLLILDVDHFKVVNDAHGHPAGDVVLRWLAEVATSQVRGTDLLARTGGEEFAVLAIDTPGDEAVALAERLRAAIQERGPVSVGRVAIPLTVSVGVASIEYLADEMLLMDPATIAAKLVADADGALYRAKQRGRNRVQNA